MGAAPVARVRRCRECRGYRCFAGRRAGLLPMRWQAAGSVRLNWCAPCSRSTYRPCGSRPRSGHRFPGCG
jgi:hypothetical protein